MNQSKACINILSWQRSNKYFIWCLKNYTDQSSWISLGWNISLQEHVLKQEAYNWKSCGFKCTGCQHHKFVKNEVTQNQITIVTAPNAQILVL